MSYYLVKFPPAGDNDENAYVELRREVDGENTAEILSHGTRDQSRWESRRYGGLPLMLKDHPEHTYPISDKEAAMILFSASDEPIGI